MIDLSVSVAIFAEFHGHGPFDALAATFLDVRAVGFLLGGFGEGLVGFKESLFEIFGLGVEWEGFHDLAFLTVGIGDDDFDLRSGFIAGEGFGPSLGIGFEIVVEFANDLRIIVESRKGFAGGLELFFSAGDQDNDSLVGGGDIKAEAEVGEVRDGSF